MKQKDQAEHNNSNWSTQNLAHVLQNPPEEFVCHAAQTGFPNVQIKIESISKKEYEGLPAPLHIEYGFVDSVFGKCMVASATRGICALRFSDGDESEEECSLKEHWPGARFELNAMKAKEIMAALFTRQGKPITLFLKGTPLQIKVWETLLSIPTGETLTYGQLAGLVGKPRAIRAVASAVAQNPIGLIIPCHRITRYDGTIGQYHWGSKRKALFIFLEKRSRILPM